jgi:hypothetical protein
MKILFAGPSLYGRIDGGRIDGFPSISVRAPAAQGDIARAVLEGAGAIGLVDGRFEDVAAPWHKEILFALASGVRVLGAASMGALRAAECAAFGMVPVGSIAARYLSGSLVNDGAVAQSHGPAELDFIPVSEALVNIEATLAALRRADLLRAPDADRLFEAARTIFFKSRSLERIVASAGIADPEHGLDLLRRHFVDIKRADALALVEALAALPEGRQAAPAWPFEEPRLWRSLLARLDHERAEAAAAAPMR